MVRALHRRFASALARHAGVRLFRFFARPLDAADSSPAPAGLALRLLEGPEVEAHCADAQLNLAADRVRDAYGRGDLCVGAFDGERLAGYCWFAFSPVPHFDGVWVEPGQDAVWIYKSFVRPSHRGRGIAPALYGFADDLGAARARRSSLLCVEAHNGASIAAAERSGHAATGSAAYLVRNGKVRAWYSPEAQRLAVSFYVPRDSGFSP